MRSDTRANMAIFPYGAGGDGAEYNNLNRSLAIGLDQA